MRLTISNERLLLIILVCLLVSTACVGQKPSKLGYIYFDRDSAIWKLDLSNGQETLLLDRHLGERIGVSPDGRTLAYTVPEEIGQGSPRSIWVVDTQTGQETKVSHTMPFLNWLWLTDSRLLVIEYPNWHISLDRTSVIKQGSAQTLIIEPSTGQSTSALWSVAPPESGKVLYAPTFDCAAKTISRDQTEDLLQAVCLDSSEPITVATPFSLGDLVWSPDGNLLAFYAGEETTTWDSWRLYLWQRESGMLREINLGDRTPHGLSFSPDNQWLAFEDDSNLCIVDLNDDDAITCFEDYMAVVGIPVSWSFDSRSVVLATCGTGICSEIGCDCSDKALVTVAIPSGEITELTRGVDIVPFPVWGR